MAGLLTDLQTGEWSGRDNLDWDFLRKNRGAGHSRSYPGEGLRVRLGLGWRSGALRNPTVASHTLPWPASGWEFRDQRLSRG